MDGWEDSWRIHGRFMADSGRGRRERARGEHRFMKLMKYKKKEKNYAVFCFAGKRRILFIYIYDVIVKQNKNCGPDITTDE